MFRPDEVASTCAVIVTNVSNAASRAALLWQRLWWARHSLSAAAADRRFVRLVRARTMIGAIGALRCSPAGWQTARYRRDDVGRDGRKAGRGGCRFCWKCPTSFIAFLGIGQHGLRVASEQHAGDAPCLHGAGLPEWRIGRSGFGHGTTHQWLRWERVARENAKYNPCHSSHFKSLVRFGGQLLLARVGRGWPVDKQKLLFQTQALTADLIQQGCELSGVDSAPQMIGMCKAQFSDCDWHVADIRRCYGNGRPEWLDHRHRARAGDEGGKIVASGTPQDILSVGESQTAPYLARTFD
jgi:hypothetical protein